MHTTPQKWFFQTPSEILVHGGVCILNGMASLDSETKVRLDVEFFKREILCLLLLGFPGGNMYEHICVCFKIIMENSVYSTIISSAP
jgi:hypothetical protein